MSMAMKRAALNCCSCLPCNCNGRCNPLVVDTETSTEVPTEACENPMPVSLNVDVTATPSDGGDTCFTGTGAITFKTPVTGGTNCWEGDIEGSCTDCNDVVRPWLLHVTMCCRSGRNRYLVVVEPGSPGVINPALAAVITSASSCDPFNWESCIPGEITGFVIACLGTMPPSPGTTYSVCLRIYE